MRHWLVFIFFISANLFAQSLNVPNGTAIYPINLMQRGKDIVNMITTLSTTPFTTTYGNSELAIQTRMLNSLGQSILIRNVVSSNVWPTTNSTILIIGSQFTKGNNNSLTFYVVPVEQIVEVIYSAYNPLIPGNSFATMVTTGILPFYEENLSQRATDIINVFSIIKKNATYFRFKSSSYFTLQTTLSGSYTPPLPNGAIPFVQCVASTPNYLCSTNNISGFTSNGTLLYVTYNSSNILIGSSYLIVGTEQIYGINYYPNP
jgi:hypothetical protein